MGVSISMKPLRVEVIARRLGGAVAQLEPRRIARPADVEVAVLQAQHLVDVVTVAGLELERRRSRARQQLDGRDAYLDLAGRQAGIDRLGRRARPPRRSPPRRIRSAGPRPAGAPGRDPRVEDELNEARTVAQVDEDEVAVVAPASHPAGEAHLAADVGEAQLAGQRRAQLAGRGELSRSPPPLPPSGLPLPLP